MGGYLDIFISIKHKNKYHVSIWMLINVFLHVSIDHLCSFFPFSLTNKCHQMKRKEQHRA